MEEGVREIGAFLKLAALDPSESSQVNSIALLGRRLQEVHPSIRREVLSVLLKDNEVKKLFPDQIDFSQVAQHFQSPN